MNHFVFHPASSRGSANHGWLQSYHTFSFAQYHNPDRMHFGVLRVLNDDTVDNGMGFGTHAHDNMEIVSIPLEGDLEHRDSMGNVTIIRKGDIQIMSAGTGITHSEFNHNKSLPVKFLQIWIFPDKKNAIPRYDQKSLNPSDRNNKLQFILTPQPSESAVWIRQNVWFSLGSLHSDSSHTYFVQFPENGVYIFLLSGKIVVNGHELNTRDGLGLWELTAPLKIDALINSEVLIMDVPMHLN